ncbi:MAG: hypothetical protein KAX46_04445 [Chromatiaceae bacterium]|nr:hypothetical protein [Chromatiaceae bacterium]
MSWATAIAILNLIPAIITAMKALEEAVPGKDLGGEKSAAIKAILLATNSQIETYWPMIQKGIDILAAFFNKTGVFTK